MSPEEAAIFDNSFAHEESLGAGFDGKPGKLASWFSGTSDPLNITLIASPTKEKQDTFFDAVDTQRGSVRSSISQEIDPMTRRSQNACQKSNSSPLVAPKDSARGKFAFWRARPSAMSKRCDIEDDEITALDIHTALFPSSIDDESTLDAFQNLRINAEKTIGQLQTAYQQKLRSIRQVTSEKNILRDELEASQTKSEHLKLQLADLVANSVDQESANQAMAEELAALRQGCREDAPFYRKSLRIVPSDSSDVDDAEILRIGHRRKKRPSTESSGSEESSSDSVFSHAPLGTCTPMSATDDSPGLFLTDTSNGATVEGVQECQNCHGVVRSEAWDVVNILKEESRALKARIAQCEEANEDALALLEVGSAMR